MSGERYGRDAPVSLAAVETRSDFGRELTALRERASLTIRDVAKAVGVPDSTIGGYFSGRHLPPLRPPDQLQKILRACGVTDPVVIEEWVATLHRLRRLPGRRPADAPIPYRGLASFQPDEAGWFFGRENLIDVVVSHLGELYRDGGLLFVVGPSGSGKSSLLRAGVIPALRSGVLGEPGSATWPMALFTPGTGPIEELAGQLARVTGLDSSSLAATLRSRPESSAELIRQAMPATEAAKPADGDGRAAGHVEQCLVMVIDQFEEVFTACSDEGERVAFIAALSAASRRPAGDLRPAALVVLGLRADFYPHALRYPELVPALQHWQVLVGPMTEPELRSAITEPARKARLEIEDGLVELVLRDLAPAAGDAGLRTAHESGSLPLMSHALLATWERAGRGRLTVADYQESGGIEGAVASSAERAFGELTGAQQELARQIFLRLVHVADDTADTRRRVSGDELLFRNDDAQHVLDLFIDRRLITADTDEVEIAHEALLSAWPRLRGWIDADRAGGRIQRQLSGAAEIWRDSDRDAHALYRGVRLASATDWADDPVHRAGLNVLERDFLQASAEHQAAEERAARRRTRGLQQLVAALGALTLVAGFLAIFAFQQKAAATHQRDLAISRQVAIDANQLRTTEPALAEQLALAAYRVSPTPEARSSLLESYSGPAVTRILGPPGVMQSVAFTHGGTVMAAAGENAVIRLWNLAHSPHPAPEGRPLHGGTGSTPGHPKTVFSVAFSPNGSTLASGGEDATVHLWDVRAPRHVVPWGPPLTGPTSTVYSVAFSPDGAILAAGSADGTVRLWDVTSPRHPVSLGPPLTWPHSGSVQSVAFSPNGRLLARGQRRPDERRGRDGAPVGRRQPASSRARRTGAGRSRADGVLRSVQPGQRHLGRRQCRGKGPAVERRRSAPPCSQGPDADRPD